MKKLFALLLACLMLLSLVSCGIDAGELVDVLQGIAGELEQTDEVTASEDEDTAPTDPAEFDFGSVMSGNSSVGTVWGKQDEATKQAMIAEGAENGMEVSFGDDGSMTVVDKATGESVTQKPDGTWVVKGADGSEGQFGGDWPENEFTKLLPKPDVELTAAATNEDEFAVLFKNVTVDQVRAYAEKVKAAGFTVDPEVQDQDFMGMVIYTYTAKNAAGYEVVITFAAGASGLTLIKP